jgi:NAD(P)-dependent dehydrogenase (short-subunit alcohol dehydrogenase family)
MEKQAQMNIAIIGGSGGMGAAMIRQLADQPEVGSIQATYHLHKPDLQHPRVNWQHLDINSEVQIEAWAGQLGEVDWLINAVGILHDPEHGPEKTIRRLEPAFYLQNMQINALPALLLAKHLQQKFRHGRPALFATISAKVGSIEDNRLGGWYSYRASKAALNMGIKTLSIEWQRTLPNVTVVAIHPGTTDTALSKPFQRNVPEHQLFSPDKTVSQILAVVRNLKPADSGQFLAFDGELLPW